MDLETILFNLKIFKEIAVFFSWFNSFRFGVGYGLFGYGNYETVFFSSVEFADRLFGSVKPDRNVKGIKMLNTMSSKFFQQPAGGQSNILFSEEPVVKTSKKIHNQKFQELTGNSIFKGDESPGTADKQLSAAKLREMSGNNIFADGKSESRDYFGGVRKPPGGESSISLV